MDGMGMGWEMGIGNCGGGSTLNSSLKQVVLHVALALLICPHISLYPGSNEHGPCPLSGRGKSLSVSI
jgi:hypothetical protein